MFAHLSNLTVAPFREFELEEARRETFDRDGADAVTLNDKWTAQLGELLFVWVAMDFNFVGFLMGEARVGEFLNEIAIIGDEQKSFAFFIKAANGDEAELESVEGFKHATSPLSIGRADFTDRFVVEEGAVGFGHFG